MLQTQNIHLSLISYVFKFFFLGVFLVSFICRSQSMGLGSINLFFSIELFFHLEHI